MNRQTTLLRRDPRSGAGRAENAERVRTPFVVSCPVWRAGRCIAPAVDGRGGSLRRWREEIVCRIETFSEMPIVGQTPGRVHDDSALLVLVPAGHPRMRPHHLAVRIIHLAVVGLEGLQTALDRTASGFHDLADRLQDVANLALRVI